MATIVYQLAESNYLGISSDTEASPQYKCFMRFLNESYIKDSLICKPTLYLDILEEFWESAVMIETEISTENQGTKMVVTSTVKGISVIFDAEDLNQALGIVLNDGEQFSDVAEQSQLMEFMTFLGYTEKINLAQLYRKCLRKEWSYVFDTLVKVFNCRKSGFDQISLVAQKIAHSLAYNYKVNIGDLVLKELHTRLGNPKKRGTEIQILDPYFELA